MRREGFRLCTDGTDNHLMLVDLRPFDADLTGKKAQEVLDKAGISLNKNQFPFDPRSPFVTSGLRIGTPSVTTQGMTESEMPLIASLIREALRHADDDSALAGVKAEVADLCARFVPYPSRSNLSSPSLSTAG
jgi:glycine hydroxymethyltransferase